MELVTADRFTIQELTNAYNRTRVDYIVPMPMNIARLREYIYLYDVDLSASWVAVNNDKVLGLGMLGIRGDRGWITRIGVLPSGRRQGIGRAITDRLLASAVERSLRIIWLEVIQGNVPAHQLFLTSGFVPTRELVVARRAPDLSRHHENPGAEPGADMTITSLDRRDTLQLLDQRKERPNWLNETESMANLDALAGLKVDLGPRGSGWVAFQPAPIQLAHIVVEVLQGDPSHVAGTVLNILHQRHAKQDAVMENLPASDPVWLGFETAGYFDAFRRLEMVLNLS